MARACIFVAAEHIVADMNDPETMSEESTLRKVFEASPSFLHVLRGPDFVFEYANDAYYRLVGRRDLIGRPAFEAMPEAAGDGLVLDLRSSAYAAAWKPRGEVAARTASVRTPSAGRMLTCRQLYESPQDSRGHAASAPVSVWWCRVACPSRQVR